MSADREMHVHASAVAVAASLLAFLGASVLAVVLAVAYVQQGRETDRLRHQVGRLRHQVTCLRDPGSGLYTRAWCGRVWWRSTR